MRLLALALFAPMLFAQSTRAIQVTAVRTWPVADGTRLAIEVTGPFEFKYDRLQDPYRVYFDIKGARPYIDGKLSWVRQVSDKLVTRIRVAETTPGVTRVVVDVTGPVQVSPSQLNSPNRLMVELRPLGAAPPALTAPTETASDAAVETHARDAAQASRKTAAIADAPKPQPPEPAAESHARDAEQASRKTAAIAELPKAQRPEPAAESHARDAAQASRKTAAIAELPKPQTPEPAAESHARDAAQASRKTAAIAEAPKPQTPELVADTRARDAAQASRKTAAIADAPKLQTPELVADTRARDAAQASRKTAGKAVSPKPETPEPAAETARMEPPKTDSPLARAPAVETPAREAKATPAESAKAARPTSSGNSSLTRALGLKLNRIVLDAGHGGHDQGTSGSKGLVEKDLVLDVTLRLGKLIEQGLGAEVIYTRPDDTFVPLEGRTALANEKKADLFLSIHANSSPVVRIAGVETYYLNFSDSKEAMDLAARENAASQRSIFELQDLLQKITLHEKIDESREFATRVQTAMFSLEQRNFPGQRNRGVKKAPFVVLIGAQMPSILVEIGFVTNPREEQLLKRGDYRQKVAENLYRGVARYAGSLSHFQVAQNQ